MNTTTDPRSDRPEPRLPGRPGSRSFSICEADNLLSKETGVNLTLDKVIDAELADYARGQAAWLEDGKVADEVEYAASNPDLAIWEGSRCLAVIKVDPEGGEPDVIRFDGAQQTIERYLELARNDSAQTVKVYNGQHRSMNEDEVRKPFRSFIVTVLGFEFVRFEGFGMTLERAIECESKNIRNAFFSDVRDGDSDEEATRDVPDTCFYEGRHLRAVLHLRSDGEVVVTRIDTKD